MPYSSPAYRRRASSFRSDLSDFDRAVARVFLGMDEIHSDVVRERLRAAARDAAWRDLVSFAKAGEIGPPKGEVEG